MSKFPAHISCMGDNLFNSWQGIRDVSKHVRLEHTISFFVLVRSRYTRVDTLTDEDLDFRERELEMDSRHGFGEFG